MIPSFALRSPFEHVCWTEKDLQARMSASFARKKMSRRSDELLRGTSMCHSLSTPRLFFIDSLRPCKSSFPPTFFSLFHPKRGGKHTLRVWGSGFSFFKERKPSTKNSKRPTERWKIIYRNNESVAVVSFLLSLYVQISFYSFKRYLLEHRTFSLISSTFNRGIKISTTQRFTSFPSKAAKILRKDGERCA